MSDLAHHLNKNLQPAAIATLVIGLVILCATITIPFLIHFHILTLVMNATNVTIIAVMLLLGATLSTLYARNRPVSDINTATAQALASSDIEQALRILCRDPNAPTQALITALKELNGSNASTELAKTLLSQKGNSLLLSAETALWVALHNPNMPEDIIDMLLSRDDIDVSPREHEAGNSRLLLLSSKRYAEKQALQEKLIAHSHFKQESRHNEVDLLYKPELHALAKPSNGLSSSGFRAYLSKVPKEALSAKFNDKLAIEYILPGHVFSGQQECESKAQAVYERYQCFSKHPGFNQEMAGAFKAALDDLLTNARHEDYAVYQTFVQQVKTKTKETIVTQSENDGKKRNAQGNYPPVGR
jgi:hypothetical protein